jgi:hypothetical protein
VVAPGVTARVPPAGETGPAQLASFGLDEAVQLVAFELPQVSVLEPPCAMDVGEAVTVATTAGPTVTVAAAGALAAPPAPVQVTEKAVVALGVTVSVPLVAPPVAKPLPVQLVASVLFQVSRLLPPLAIVVGDAVRVAVTAAPTVTVAFAGALVALPGPVHVTE